MLDYVGKVCLSYDVQNKIFCTKRQAHYNTERPKLFVRPPQNRSNQKEIVEEYTCAKFCKTLKSLHTLAYTKYV